MHIFFNFRSRKLIFSFPRNVTQNWTSLALFYMSIIPLINKKYAFWWNRFFFFLEKMFPSWNNLIGFIYTWPNFKLRKKWSQKMPMSFHGRRIRPCYLKKQKCSLHLCWLLQWTVFHWASYYKVFRDLHQGERGKSVSSEKSPKLMKNLKWLDL